MADTDDIFDEAFDEEPEIEDEKRQRLRRILIITTAICLMLMILVIPFSFLVEFIPGPNENETTTPITSAILEIELPFEISNNLIEEMEISCEVTPQVFPILIENIHIVSFLIPKILV